MTENNVHPERPVPVQIQLHGNPVPGLGACLECIGQYKMHVNNADKMANEEPPPDINFAVTTAPSWQQEQRLGQIFLQCVPVPVCFLHIGVQEITPAQRAAQSGLIVPGG